jgi:hypothetical protein
MKTERPKADDAPPALAFGSLMANHVRALANRPLIPKIVDVTHASKESAAFFHSFFTAKSRHDVDATMNHFLRDGASVRTPHVAAGAAVKNQSAEVSHSARRIENKRLPATGSTQGANFVDRTISTLATTAP